MSDFLKNIKVLVSEGKFDIVKIKLREMAFQIGGEYENQILLLIQRLSTELNSNIQIQEEEVNVNRNRIALSLLDIISKIDMDENVTLKLNSDSKFKNYFGGEKGATRLKESFKNQELVGNNEVIANKLSGVCELGYFFNEQIIYEENELSNEVLFFVLLGRVELRVSNKKVALIPNGECFGEFPLLDPGIKLAVSSRTKEDSIIGMIAFADFEKIATAHCEIWKNMAKMLAKRLRDRNLII